VMKPIGIWWRNVNIYEERDDREDVFLASAMESGRTEGVDLVYHIIPRTYVTTLSLLV